MSTTSVLAFTCSICGDPSQDICVHCTKDACHLHRCQRCLRCSDCCECELPLSADDEIVPEPVSNGRVLAGPVSAPPAPPPDPQALVGDPYFGVPEPVTAEAAPPAEPDALALAGEGAVAPELSPTLMGGFPLAIEPAEPGIPLPQEPDPEPEPEPEPDRKIEHE